ncbi:hypothetical protein SAMN02745218_02055 [Desulfofundulus australicus DSM 11792]|uniref:Uncharacterized protein n=2 Tax=Desulfofundulus australicus TaxID=1566 RepID=A0A1M5B252_9FIRM|nr:hypothetical protein SAMN02745218_02055 [Desulfofundulus australicus DSM 11792]
MDLAGRNISLELILDRAWLAPARCCLVNADGHETVERAFTVLRETSGYCGKNTDLTRQNKRQPKPGKSLKNQGC